MTKPRTSRTAAPDEPPDAPGAGVAPDLVPHLWRLRTQFRDGRDAEKLLRAALRLGMDLYRAAEGCVATVQPGGDDARILFAAPPEAWWDRPMLAAFLRGEKVRVPPDLMLARLRRHGRMWGALAARRDGASYQWDARQGLSAIAALANELIDRIDDDRVREVRARIDRKVLEQSQPKHLFYEILHAIRSLAAYDHSAALLTYDPDRDALEVVAEQVAWQKAKGRNVGLVLPLAPPLRALLGRGPVCGFDRRGRSWADWTGTDATDLAELLDYDRATPREGAILCAPLVTRAGPLGLLKVASMSGGAFCRYEVDLLAQFLPQAAVALRNARRAESLEEKVLQAERKHAMADLARGVAHDVNNTLGGVLPLVQQLRDDLARGDFDPEVAAADLAEIERSIQAGRRIFGGMLAFARGLARNPSEVALAQAVEGALALVRPGLERDGVRLVLDLPDDLPPLFGVQADVEQLLLNLLSNARDATRPGDELALRAACTGAALELLVADTGCGMTRDQLARAQEPFFTTKPGGHGLGLAICRSIVSQMRGNLAIDSAPGAGTRVRVVLPVGEEGGP